MERLIRILLTLAPLGLLPIKAEPQSSGLAVAKLPYVRELIVVPPPASFRSFADVMRDVLR